MSPDVRPLSSGEAEAVAAARLVAVEAAPYLAHALFAMQPVAAEGLGTFAVDGAWRLYLDPQTLAAWGPALSGAVMVHEVGHLLREHAARAKELGADVDHSTWNYATDAAINDDVLAAGVSLPEGVVTPATLGLPANGIEEGYYAQLRRDRPDLATPDQAEPEVGCGSGAGDPAAAWELPAGDETAGGVSEAEAELTRRVVAHEIREHAARRRGTVPAGLQRWAEQNLAAPTVPWQRVLGASVRRAIAWARGATDWTYNRPGRRRLPGIITPAMRRPQVNAAVVIDTSGSMGQEMTDAALAEVKGVIRAAGLGPRGLVVLACDAAVGASTRVRRAEDVRIVGGGGTDLRVGIAAAQALRPAPDVIVVLTDGYTPWPAEPTRARLVVALVAAPGAHPSGTPTWATTVHIPIAG